MPWDIKLKKSARTNKRLEPEVLPKYNNNLTKIGTIMQVSIKEHGLATLTISYDVKAILLTKHDGITFRC